jgi:uncharacterized protein
VIDAGLRDRLLLVAREAIVACAAARLYEVPGDPGADVQGAFVTLRRRADHELRGCVGTLRPPTEGLARLVAETARAAALRDSRFSPVRPAEVSGLRVEISLLGPLEPIAAQSVEVGRHGLVLRAAGRSGLLLPQVAAEHGWAREDFLDALCRKAGVRGGTWREPGCELLAFTALVFGEP